MKKIMELGQVRRGEVFTFAGEKFVKLNDDGCDDTFVVLLDAINEPCAFESENNDREDHNNFVGSNLERVINDWLRKHPALDVVVVDRPIDLLSMDGMTDYGKPVVHGRALTIDEYRKYRRFIPLASDWYWTATPWCTVRSPLSSNGSYAYSVSTDGTQGSHYVYNANSCPRPALYLVSSIFVSVETDEENGLCDYTDAELLEELLRRRAENAAKQEG